MLQLQRASAGSGKTYTLAKKFIWFLIAIKEEGRPWRLRTGREIADGLGRILAITFTNKATNEMKQRIVERLSDLSKADTPTPVSASTLKDTPYLADFAKDLQADPRDVGHACGEALAALLNQYSDFHVSTIDSFFQTILRTFAYESNLNDAYQVEIDTDYLATAAIDATLDDIDSTGGSASAASFWIELLIKEASGSGNQWNVFQKSDAQRSIYSRLRNSIRRLESEDFKKIRQELDDYFESSSDADPLAEAYVNIRQSLETPLKEALDKARNLCLRLKIMLQADGADPSKDCQRWFDGHLRKLPALSHNEPDNSRLMFKPLAISPKKPLFKKGTSFPHAAEMTRLAEEMYEEFSRWLALRESPEWRHWKVYAPLIPYLGLLGEARKKMHFLLEANNMIQLGETNSMLKRIIGEDDTPFIYERLGTAINHYLIDEFQDTSRMQWENLRPLLLENDSRGHDNLIIGDAKQSIYRFRNADPSLITTSVPEVFPRHLAAGMSKAENTNWRSDRRIVEFNNFFFTALVERLTEIRDEKGGRIDFANLYSNVAQYPSHRKEEGYVEIRFLSLPEECSDKDTSPKGGEPQKADSLESVALAQVGPLVSSLIARGYRQRDIALLVDTNQLGKDVIAALIDHNTSLPPEETRIEFISEESLLVSSSEAVGIIINVLEKMAGGSIRPDSSEDEEGRRPFNDIRCNFSFYALRHPEMSPAEQVEGFLKEKSPADAINCMLADMQTVALPALVEAITENFVPVNLRRSQAVFIAALQDMVLEYCDRYASDVASFLSWWKGKGAARSISSPEGTDAVQIMTVHKAKGLEFKCVILPFAKSSFVPTLKSEWRWVRPSGCLSGHGLPPYLPVETRPDLEETDHADIYREYYELYIMDRLNSCYVAFTRAVSELYIFTKMPGKSEKTIGYFLHDICGNADQTIPALLHGANADFLLPPGLSAWDKGRTILSFGQKHDPAQAEKADTQDPEEEENESDNPSANRFMIEEYGVDSSPAILHYVEGDDTSGTSTLMPEATDTDPRSEGNLLHSILSLVKVAADLPRAILTMKMRGAISSAQAREWEPMLAKALADKRVAPWFKPGWKVMNERDIIFPRAKNRRPDRIMISPDNGGAIIVDYKFGAVPKDDSHIEQVREYVSALRETSGLRRISGYIWYVRLHKIIEVSL